MAIVEDRIVLTIGFFDLVERLGDQESLDAVPRHEGERAFEEIEAAQRRKFIKHQEQAPRPRAGIEFLGEPPRSEEHTSELQSLMRHSYAVFCSQKKITNDFFRTSTNVQPPRKHTLQQHHNT